MCTLCFLGYDFCNDRHNYVLMDCPSMNIINLCMHLYNNYHAEGVNGILPNLDLVNVVSYLCQSEGIHVFFHTTVRF